VAAAATNAVATDAAATNNAARSREEGSAVVEFVLVSVLLVMLLLGVLQVGVYVYARNVISEAAGDGARYAATTDPDSGAQRAPGLITTGLNGRVASQVPCTGTASTDAPSGLPTDTVRCRGSISLVFLPVGIPLSIDIGATVLREGQP
jgi:Flp pilus assembly protein TadG